MPLQQSSLLQPCSRRRTMPLPCQLRLPRGREIRRYNACGARVQTHLALFDAMVQRRRRPLRPRRDAAAGCAPCYVSPSSALAPDHAPDRVLIESLDISIGHYHRCSIRHTETDTSQTNTAHHTAHTLNTAHTRTQTQTGTGIQRSCRQPPRTVHTYSQHATQLP